MAVFDHERFNRMQKRGAWQGMIIGRNGWYHVYQKDGTTHGYLVDNETNDKPDYIGSEQELYSIAGTKPFPVRSRF